MVETRTEQDISVLLPSRNSDWLKDRTTNKSLQCGAIKAVIEVCICSESLQEEATALPTGTYEEVPFDFSTQKGQARSFHWMRKDLCVTFHPKASSLRNIMGQ